MASKFKVVSLGKLSGGSLEPEKKEMASVKGEVELVEARPTSEDELISVAKDADAILGGGRFLTRRVMEALPKCKVIVTYSVGFDSIDVDIATDNHIIVVNNPAVEWCVEEVSNHALMLLLACAKKLVRLDRMVKAGEWATKRGQIISPMGRISGETLGLVAFGKIPRALGRKALALKLRCLAYDPYVPPEVMR